MNLYSEHILDHYHNPRMHGNLEVFTHSSQVHNPTCGDRLQVELFLENGILQKLAWTGEGCAISQASASLLLEKMEGKTEDEARSFQKQEVLEILGIPVSPGRLKCAILSLEALHAALNNPKNE